MECDFVSDSEKLEQLFTLCDRNSSGFIEEEDLNDLCDSLGLDRESITEIFAPLSKSGSTSIIISKDDFKTGFAHIQQVFCPGEEQPDAYGNQARRQSRTEGKFNKFFFQFSFGRKPSLA